MENTNKIAIEDLYSIEKFNSYRGIYNNLEYREKAHLIFEDTNGDLKAVDEYCTQMLKKPIIDKLIRESQINKRFQNRTFDNYKPQNESQFIGLKKSRDYANNIYEYLETGINLILAGAGCVGTGKTHLACSIAHCVMNNNIPTKFINVTSMIDDIKKDFNITQFTNVDLLIIDDLGKEKNSDWVCEQIYSIINSRYEQMKPTIITTEGTIEDLKNKYNEKGRAIISRLIQDFIFIKLTGEDYRKKV